jgi:hypothetical protein
MPMKFLNEIFRYTGIFTSYADFKAHILKDYFNKEKNFQTGTEIFLCSLNYTFNSYEKDIFLISESKKRDKTDLHL